MFLARDIMVKSIVTVKKNQTVKEALDLLAKHNVSGLPVVDDAGKVVGVISGTDIMQYSYLKQVVPQTGVPFWISPYLEVDDIASIRQGFEVLHRTMIETVMTKKVYTVTEETPVSEIAKLLIKRKINRVPVVNHHHKLTGIITRTDLVKFMAESET
jgi:CBS domain-containing protein